MRVHYDQEFSVLRVATGKHGQSGASLLDYPDIALELATVDGYDIVGLLVMGASAYLPLGTGYDAVADTLTLGERPERPDLTTETGDFVGYWRTHAGDPAGMKDPVGVTLRHASRHLAPVLRQLGEQPARVDTSPSGG